MSDSPAMTRLGHLIARMMFDENLVEDFLYDEDSVIERAGLSGDEAVALRSKNFHKILRQLVPGDTGAADAQRDPAAVADPDT